MPCLSLMSLEVTSVARLAGFAKQEDPEEDILRYRTYGNTDLSVSAICYGTMRYASKGGVLDDRSKAGSPVPSIERPALETHGDAMHRYHHSPHA